MPDRDPPAGKVEACVEAMIRSMASPEPGNALDCFRRHVSAVLRAAAAYDAAARLAAGPQPARDTDAWWAD